MKNVIFAGLVALKASIALSASPQVIGGTPRNRADFPEVVQLVVDNGQGLCSGTIIGPHVLLTAGHCAADGETITANLADGTKTTAKCTLSPAAGKVEGQGNDLSLCFVQKAQFPAHFGTVDTAGVTLNETVTIAGFGCTQSDQSGGNDGILRVGNAQVSALDGQDDADPFDFKTTSRVVVCPGDSGGPDFRQGQHRVISVNSKVSVIQQDPIQFGNDSFLTSLDTQASKDFIAQFIAANSVSICGVNLTCP